ncbi:ZNF559-ZNF177 readthrough [Homo sapiens]|uniref:ZNF559-ZNF177 readthrough n=2 Tax=Homo sapiens TaxID=9606 RepID=S4R3H7_HUMAN|nr:ZNF559-ZNF177 readthrough [Homo sapiens]KAI4040189.1 ZNF559-ZNF177 readthrough [Homo sapiens]
MRITAAILTARSRWRLRNSISAFLFTVTFAWCPPGLSNLTILSCPEMRSCCVA